MFSYERIQGSVNRALPLLAFVCVAVVSVSCAAPAERDASVVTTVDADADGIPDAIDQCADTPTPQPVDFEGCPEFAGALPNLNFPGGSADLDQNARASLDQLVSRLQSYPQVVIALDGHTDNRGAGRDNLELSKQRVMAVVRYLVSRGVAPHRLRPFGYGESRPAVSNATAAGREQNRRIEVSVVLPVPQQAAAESG